MAVELSKGRSDMSLLAKDLEITPALLFLLVGICIPSFDLGIFNPIANYRLLVKYRPKLQLYTHKNSIKQQPLLPEYQPQSVNFE
jgi:hypothetical protein